ncbi:hypothetical protein [Mucilaginibacter segetis]|uniref:Uncharacterized protein n=1 Tax=Mucilaginibacter segetis TaxID=2793071 RepID=A0A934UL03_9SPHI|nr:hypothetical protein [Mucilaginibacter segetis]MBK0377844.1 hypothetical protein [Mucilaginibacter segetis]
MIRSLIAYRHIKNLCRFFESTSNTFKIINSETITVISGRLSGLVFEFDFEACRVKTNNRYTCLDLADDYSTDTLLKVLLSHNIIRYSDLELYD